MTTANQTEEDAKRIWEQLDAEDNGAPAPAAESDEGPTSSSAAANQAAVEMPQAKEQPASQDNDDVQMYRDKIAGLETMVQQLSGRVRNAEGHIGGLSSQLKQQVQAAQAVQARGGDAPSATELRQAQADPESFKRLKEDYPEFAAALEPALDHLVKSELQKIKASLTPVEQAQVDVVALTDGIRRELTVEVRHPGWKKDVKTPEFTGWLQRAPREVQMLAGSDDPDDAVRLLDLYKAPRQKQVTTQNAGIQAAAALPTGRSSGVRQKSVDDMTPQEYWAYLDSIDKHKG